MILSPQDTVRFYRIWFVLLHFADERRRQAPLVQNRLAIHLSAHWRRESGSLAR